MWADRAEALNANESKIDPLSVRQGDFGCQVDRTRML